MSLVSNYILISHCLDNEAQLDHLYTQHGLYFKEVANHAGGCKGIEWDVYMLATNYQDTEEVLGIMSNVVWDSPIQLFSAEQSDEKWQEIDTSILKVENND